MLAAQSGHTSGTPSWRARERSIFRPHRAQRPADVLVGSWQ
jgi:hypothetical protein